MVAIFLKNLKSTFVSVKNSEQKILGVDNMSNSTSMQKSQFEIRYILGCTKMTSLTKFSYFRMCSTVHRTPQIHTFFIFSHRKHNEFRIGSYTAVEFIIIYI